MLALNNHRGIWITSIIWLICIAAALLAAVLKSTDITELWPIAGIATIPALMSLLMTPFLKREWAQILVIFAWIALAILASLAISFVPMAVLFMCAPAIAALFEKEKVIETMVLAALAASGLFYYGKFGGGPDLSLASEVQINWGVTTAIAATIGLLIAALYGVAASKSELILGEDFEAEPQTKVEFAHDDDVLDAVPGGLLRVDSEDNIIMQTQAVAAQLNLSTSEVAPTISDLFSDADQESDLRNLLERARAIGREVTRKFHLTYGEGDSRTAEITAAPIEGGDVLLHVYDSTAHEARLKSIHSAYASAQKDADSKSLFFAGVSHELRTPLNAIIGFSDMMRSRLFGPLPGKYAEYAELIHDSGQHMLDLIGDVLDMSKVEAGKYELAYNSFDASDVIRSSVKMLRPAADSAEVQMDVEIHGEEGELLVDADRKALRQIILNLLSNAIKFTPKGGRVVIKGEVDDRDLSLTVEDNGAGMTPEELESIGKPYMQTETGMTSEVRGSGLGLTLVKSLAALHGGRMDLTSEKWIGTTATITIPRQRS
ncbi:MAG: HAMP domain-containing histidine kinase [Hellea sp.]|nr:HAMP domain-containing histidine kinase [Hellea sp.]